MPSEVCGAVALGALIANKHSCRTLHENRALSEKNKKRNAGEKVVRSSLVPPLMPPYNKTAHVPTAYIVLQANSNSFAKYLLCLSLLCQTEFANLQIEFV